MDANPGVLRVRYAQGGCPILYVPTWFVNHDTQRYSIFRYRTTDPLLPSRKLTQIGNCQSLGRPSGCGVSVSWEPERMDRFGLLGRMQVLTCILPKQLGKAELSEKRGPGRVT